MGKNHGKWDTQTKDSDGGVWVGVSSDGHDYDTDTDIASEFIIQSKDPKHHIHLGLDECGNEIFRKER